MKFWKRHEGLEHELRALRREPRPEFLQSVMNKIEGDRYRRPRRSVRLGVVVTITAGLLAALAAFGGLGYAASGVSRAVGAALPPGSPAKRPTPSGGASSA